MEQIAYVNGSFVPLSEAKVSILDRGFLFADGIYEVAAVLDGKLIDNASHLARLERSVGEIELALPETTARIQEIQQELIKRNNLVNGMVYLEVTRGADTGRDFAFPKGVKPTLIMFTSTKDIINAPSAKTGIKVITVPDLRWTRRDIKSVALLAQVLAKQAAAAAGAGEAWMIEDGKVTEGGSSSCFILTQDDVIVTRQNGSEILPGCTRKAVVALAEERQLRVEERAFSVEEALAAKEAFVTSASVFVQAVVSIDGKMVADGKPGPMTNRLREIYVEFAKATAVYDAPISACRRPPCAQLRGGRSSIPETSCLSREAAAYWMPRYAGMTAECVVPRAPPRHSFLLERRQLRAIIGDENRQQACGLRRARILADEMLAAGRLEEGFARLVDARRAGHRIF